MKKIQWLFFDFGGCLDSDGVHSRELFLKHFEMAHLISPEQKTLFQGAYSHADKMIITQALVTESRLMEMNMVMASLIDRRLGSNTSVRDIHHVAQAITDEQAFYLNRNKIILGQLKKEHKLGVVSNFSGNLHVILNEFDLDKCLSVQLDSFRVGLSKPDKNIFKLALNRAPVEAESACFIGDNPDRDIAPAQSLGMKTVLLTDKETKSSADATINSLSDLPRALELL